MIPPCLPGPFLARMEALLGQSYPSFAEAYSRPPFRGVRRNPLKCTEETLLRSLPMGLTPTPFAPTAYYADWAEGFGRLPAHHAGMFYAQEPSAASAVTALDPQPGERVLDWLKKRSPRSEHTAGDKRPQLLDLPEKASPSTATAP